MIFFHYLHVTFDPRPPNQRQINVQAIEDFCCDLLSLPAPCAFLDMSCVHRHGLLEIKCPYSKRDETPEEACQDAQFFCTLENSEVRLKHSNPYFHKVHLQLYVASDFAACWHIH